MSVEKYVSSCENIIRRALKNDDINLGKHYVRQVEMVNVDQTVKEKA